jgi:hypothetical protein
MAIELPVKIDRPVLEENVIERFPGLAQLFVAITGLITAAGTAPDGDADAVNTIMSSPADGLRFY